MEIKGDRYGAQNNYRVALSIDPSYEPTIKNLQRSTDMKWKLTEGILLEDIRKDKK
jgi:hypothetical protein